MHEVSLTQDIVEICSRHAEGKRVRKVRLDVGLKAGVLVEALEFCFESCTVETLLEGATLEIHRTFGADLRVTEIEVDDGPGTEV